MKKTCYAALLLMISILLGSCGGGGGGGSGATAGVSAEPATVGLVITDAITDEWDEARATITQVSLIGDGGQEILFSGEKTVDLLSLREHLKLFVVKPGVRPGYYSKIRLQIKELVLVKNNDAAPPTLQPVKVPSNKVDLNPQGTFHIAPGSVVFASLDWDMEKSLKFTETGSGKWIMRPVIFANIGSKPAFKKGLVRLFGTVQTVATDFSSFRLCSSEGPAPLPSAETGKDFCIDVLVDARTGLFDETGKPRAIGTLTPKEPLTVFGWLRLTHGDDGDPTPVPLPEGNFEPTKLQIMSIVVEGGPEGTWKQVRGALTTPVNAADNTFGFDPDAGQGYDDTTLLTGELFAQSRVFRLDTDGNIDEVFAPYALLSSGDRARVDAVPTGTDRLNIALMLSRPAPVTETVSGTITNVSLGQVTIDGTELVCTDFDTKVFLLSGAGVIEITVIELPVGSPAVATGITPAGSGCLQADVIVAQAAIP
jgi:uncharacterized protein DUF4382